MKRNLIFMLLIVIGSTGFGSHNEYIITQFGAVPDSVTITTAVIQNAINIAAANCGEIIVIPSGVFLSGALFFDRIILPIAQVRNILVWQVNVKCDTIGELIGNPHDTIEDINFVDCKIRTLEHLKFTTIYEQAITFDCVTIHEEKQ